MRKPGKKTPVDLLLSGIYGAVFVDAESLAVASEIFAYHSHRQGELSNFRQLLAEKYELESLACCHPSDALSTQDYVDLYERLLGSITAEASG
jgi:hypothetical protein